MNPLVSVIVELGTREVTGRLPLLDSVLNKTDAAQGVDGEVELIFVGEHALPPELCRDGVRSIAAPETGYYGWKNAGAAAARGDYLVFWDSDCRPSPGYLQRVLAAFEADPELGGIAGRSVYDGTSFLSRMNTVLSFGYLARPVPTLLRDVALSHNVAIRRNRFPREPFGPFIGRVGGDAFLTNWALDNGHPLKLGHDLLVYHEDPSWSLTGLLERHLRDIFVPLLHEDRSKRPAVIRAAWQSLMGLLVRRPVKLLRWGRFCGFGTVRTVAALPVLAVYFALDVLVLLALTLQPRLLDRWLRWQFGDAA